jgi:hypothetical protein
MTLAVSGSSIAARSLSDTSNTNLEAVAVPVLWLLPCESLVVCAGAVCSSVVSSTIAVAAAAPQRVQQGLPITDRLLHHVHVYEFFYPQLWCKIQAQAQLLWAKDCRQTSPQIIFIAFIPVDRMQLGTISIELLHRLRLRGRSRAGVQLASFVQLLQPALETPPQSPTGVAFGRVEYEQRKGRQRS